MRKLLGGKGFAWVPGLTARASGRSRTDDHRFTDEEILTVVRAGEAGMKLADLCQATGIPLDTYYAWKALYGGLTPAQVRTLRAKRRARQRHIKLLACGVCGAAVLLGAVSLTRQSDASSVKPVTVATTVSQASTAARPTVTPPAIEPRVSTTTSVPAAAPTPAPRAEPPVAQAAVPVSQPATPERSGTAASTSSRDSRADVSSTGDLNGYSVQVAAVPNLQEARIALERLSAAGYPTFMTTTTVSGNEMYRVRVGPLLSRDHASDIAARLKNEGYSSPWVTR